MMLYYKVIFNGEACVVPASQLRDLAIAGQCIVVGLVNSDGEPVDRAFDDDDDDDGDDGFEDDEDEHAGEGEHEEAEEEENDMVAATTATPSSTSMVSLTDADDAIDPSDSGPDSDGDADDTSNLSAAMNALVAVGKPHAQPQRPTASSLGMKAQKEDLKTKRKLVLQSSVHSAKTWTVIFDYPAYLGVGKRQLDDAPFADDDNRVNVREAVTNVVVKFKISEEVWRYNCVVNALKRGGLVETKSAHAWNVLWGRHLSPTDLQQLKWFQRVNHFPGSQAMGRKDRLVRSVSEMRRRFRSSGEFDFLPDTFLLPNERSMLESRHASSAASSSSRLWIVKPVSSSCGRGIKIVNNIDDIKRRRKCVVSRYIANPLLIDGFKFDLRLYVLVTSYHPLKVYMFENGLVRFATHKYTKTRGSLKNTFVHLTNYSINKKSKKFVRNTDAEQDSSGSKWSVRYLREYLRTERGIDDDALFKRIHDVVIKTIISTEAHVNSNLIRNRVGRNTCFEVLGFDVLIDDQLKPWLLEVNVAPSLSSSSPLDKHIKNMLMTDVFHLIGVRPIAAKKAAVGFSVKAQYKKRMARSESGTLNFVSGSGGSGSGGKGSTFGGGKRARKHYTQRLAGESLDKITLSDEDVTVLRQFEDEQVRRGHFQCIFPTAENAEFYARFFEQKRYFNVLLAKWLRLEHEQARRVLVAPGNAAKVIAIAKRKQLQSKAKQKKKNRRPASSAPVRRSTSSTSSSPLAASLTRSRSRSRSRGRSRRRSSSRSSSRTSEHDAVPRKPATKPTTARRAQSATRRRGRQPQQPAPVVDAVPPKRARPVSAVVRPRQRKQPQQQPQQPKWVAEEQKKENTNNSNSSDEPEAENMTLELRRLWSGIKSRASPSRSSNSSSSSSSSAVRRHSSAPNTPERRRHTWSRKRSSVARKWRVLPTYSYTMPNEDSDDDGKNGIAASMRPKRRPRTPTTTPVRPSKQPRQRQPQGQAQLHGHDDDEARTSKMIWYRGSKLRNAPSPIRRQTAPSPPRMVGIKHQAYSRRAVASAGQRRRATTQDDAVLFSIPPVVVSKPNSMNGLYAMSQSIRSKMRRHADSHKVMDLLHRVKQQQQAMADARRHNIQ